MSNKGRNIDQLKKRVDSETKVNLQWSKTSNFVFNQRRWKPAGAIRRLRIYFTLDKRKRKEAENSLRFILDTKEEETEKGGK